MKPSHHPLAAALPIVAASFTVISISSAAPLYWKTSTAAAWDSATWATTPGGSYDQPWVSGSEVVFEDNLGTTLTIAGPSAPTDFSAITANENVTLTPASTLGTGGTMATIDIAAGKTLNFAAQGLSTAAGTGFIKNGPGTLSLSNGNAYPGGFTLNAGTVAVGNANAMGSGGALVINGGTIRSTGTGAQNLSGKFASITLGGDVVLGDVTNTGALTFNGATSLGAATRTFTVNSLVTHTGAISGPGVGLIKAGPGVLSLGGANTYGGPTTISAGVLSITNTAALPGGFTTNGTYSVASGAGLAVPNAVTDADITSMLGTTNFAAGSAIGFDTTAGARTRSADLGNTAQGNLGLVKTGTNALTLSGNNTYAGGTNVWQANDSTGIIVGSATALGTGPVVVNGGQTFSHSVSVGANLSVGNAITLKRGAGGNRAVLGLNANSNWSGGITVDNTLSNGIAVISANGAGTVASPASVVSGNIGFSTLGTPSSTSPTLVLRSNTGRVTGSISLSNGYLQTLDSSKWEFSNASNTWGTLDVSHDSSIVTVGAENTLSPSGVVTSTSPNGGTLQLNNQASTLAFNQSIAGLSGKLKVGLTTGAATLTLNTATDLTSSGAVSGAISLVKSGTGKQTLASSTNSYTGSTTINGGTLSFGSTGVMPSNGDLSISSGTLDLRKGTSVRNQQVNNLTLSNATLEFGLNAMPDKLDALDATVSGTNTVKLFGSTPVGTYDLIVSGAPLTGTFVLDTSGVIPSGFPTSYSGSIQGNSYVLTVTGAATPLTAYWRGDVSSVWNDSSLAPNSNWATDDTGTTDAGQIPGPISDVYFSAASAANTSTTLGANTNINSLTFESGSATVGGSHTLTILNEFGTGLDVLPGASATLETGDLVCTSASSVQAGGTLTVNSGGLGTGPLVVDGTLNLNMNVTKESLGGASTGSITRGIAGAGTLTVSGTNSSLYDGTLGDGAGTMALAKGGSSTLTLSGNNSYSGGTTVSGGIIQSNGNTALGTGTVSLTSTANKIYLGGGVTLANNVAISSTGSTDYQGFITANGGAPATVIGTVTIGSIPSTGGHFASSGTGSVLRLMGPVNVTGSIAPNARVGTVEVGGGGNYTEFRIGEGTLRLAAGNGLNPAAVLSMAVSNPATFDLAGFNQTLAGVNQNNTRAATIGNSSTTADSVLTTTGTATFGGVITDTLGTGNRKTGIAVSAGALTLAGVNTYTGDTTVATGASFTLADNARVRFSIATTSGINNSLTGAGTATLDGDFDIDTTLVDASSLTSGSWTLEDVASLTGAFGTTFQVTSGATAWTATGDVWAKTVGDKAYSFDETTGVLTMTSTGGSFDAWATSKGLAGADAAFDADPDHDGIDNGLEFVLGGEPNPANPGSNSAALLPTISQSAGNLIFTFKRKDLSESGVTLSFQWSTGLSFPSPANDIPVGATDSTSDTIVVDVTEDSPDSETDTIVVTIPSAKAAGGKLFGRLSAVTAP